MVGSLLRELLNKHDAAFDVVIEAVLMVDGGGNALMFEI